MADKKYKHPRRADDTPELRQEIRAYMYRHLRETGRFPSPHLIVRDLWLASNLFVDELIDRMIAEGQNPYLIKPDYATYTAYDILAILEASPHIERADLEWAWELANTHKASHVDKLAV